ncbi:nickel pincer cofactor biosynthesis protein LarB [Methanobacterium sp. ACI-7]|uniref:nickel pincer cofactor biosynthesis protein LarB n=1 Tax=unclassified Methanobacterium TaxID=2627676 RepID=UPI0039C3424B
MKEILQKLLNGEFSIEEAEKMLKTNHIEYIEDFAQLDTSRHLRTGIPEVIFAENKEKEDLTRIVMHCANMGHVMVTRLSEEKYESIKPEIDSLKQKGYIIEYSKKARILVIKDHKIEKKEKIGILTAGTSDIPIAEEARITAEEMGCEAITSYDAGVAGIHRLFSPIKRMLEEEVKAIIVVAGMEGALPSVVTGLVDVPVVGVPTSVGYGVGEGGFTALYAMLQSCAPGIAVVNIDNGFGAGVFAAKIAKQS